ncbi:MAG: hypothetical protein MHPSP_004532, partial [Paramarteilia canceri]
KLNNTNDIKQIDNYDINEQQPASKSINSRESDDISILSVEDANIQEKEGIEEEPVIKKRENIKSKYSEFNSFNNQTDSYIDYYSDMSDRSILESE